jgi:hypothetical protein
MDGLDAVFGIEREGTGDERVGKVQPDVNDEGDHRCPQTHRAAWQHATCHIAAFAKIRDFRGSHAPGYTTFLVSAPGSHGIDTLTRRA